MANKDHLLVDGAECSTTLLSPAIIEAGKTFDRKASLLANLSQLSPAGYLNAS